MDDSELDDIRDLGVDLEDLDRDLRFEGGNYRFEDGEDPEVAYNLGLIAGPRDRCPFKTQDAIDEWNRGKADADRREIYSMREGTPPDYYRDPD
jgi:hypothetical protein